MAQGIVTATDCSLINVYSASIKIVLLIEHYCSRLLGSLHCTSCSNMHDMSTVSVHIIAKHIYIYRKINLKALNLDWRVAMSTCVCMYVLNHRKQ